ncbi:hypothetical protein [Nocardia puris]|uniref:hypothetical protein n=1 Tax=Nocardia puris TaxID=208602 RepID=UPI002E207A95
MTFPPGAGFDGTEWGVGSSGAPSMAGRTETAVTDHLKTTMGDGRWGQIEGGIFAIIAAAIAAILGGFATVLDAIFGIVDNQYVSDLPIITDHTQQLADLEAAVQAAILQGDAWVFVDGEVWTPSQGVLFLEVILIAAGAGGGGGRGDALPGQRSGGAGGGGGGEVHYLRLPASLLPKDGSGAFLPLEIGIGAGGAGGAARTGSDGFGGQGGGNTTFGPLGQPAWLTAGGGNGGGGGLGGGIGGGGGAGRGSHPGLGGVGMIPGGDGGAGGGGDADLAMGSHGGGSYASHDLYGGGGGGGGGGGNNIGGNSVGGFGGQGGISPGGITGQPGTSPSAVVATGGGGGGGGSAVQAGAAGGYPAGGGGGGSENASGGAGANGIAYIIERFS